MTEDSAKLAQLPEAPPDIGGCDPVAQESATDERQYARKQREIELEGSRYELVARKTYAERVFWLVAIWIGLVLCIVVLSGYEIGPKIADGVLVALITGLSVNVIGLLAIVINYLFPKRGKD